MGTLRCTAREASRNPLDTGDGRALYVQPSAAVANRRGEVLLVGETNYAFRPDSGGAARIVMRDSVFGAVADADGHARIVRSPIPARLLAGVRAAARDDGTWDVLFAELRPYSGASRTDSVARLWHGVVQDTVWQSIETVPLPPGGWLRADPASSPVRFGDTLAWALPLHTRGINQVAVFLRTPAGWSHQVLPTISAAYAEPGHSASAGLFVLVVQPDPSLRSDGNSLFVWTRTPEWRPLAKLVDGRVEEVHHPVFRTGDGHATLAWTTPVGGGEGSSHLQARAAALFPLGTLGPAATLDSAIVATTRVVGLGGTLIPQIWAVGHMGPEGREIRIVRAEAGTARVLARVSDPYMTSFNAAALSESDFVITGGASGAGGPVRTVLIHLRLRCRP